MKRKKSFLIIMCFALLLLFAFIFFFGRQGKIDNLYCLLMNWLRNGKEIKTYRAVEKIKKLMFLDSKPCI